MNKRGFTLIELMVVIVIIGILAAVAIPKFTQAASKARITEILATRGHNVTDKQLTDYHTQFYTERGADGTYVGHRNDTAIALLIIAEIKGIKPVKKTEPVVSKPTTINGVTVDTPKADGVTVAGEFVLFGKDVRLTEAIKTLKQNQIDNGYKYIDSVTTEGNTIKVKLRKY